VKLISTAVAFGMIFMLSGAHASPATRGEEGMAALSRIQAVADQLWVASSGTPLAMDVNSIEQSLSIIRPNIGPTTKISADYVQTLQADADSLSEAARLGAADLRTASLVAEVAADLGDKVSLALRNSNAAAFWEDTVVVSIDTISAASKKSVDGYRVGCNTHRNRANVGTVRWAFGKLSSDSKAPLPAGFLTCYAFDPITNKLVNLTDADVGHGGGQQTVQIAVP
jgi:hypothetical protein